VTRDNRESLTAWISVILAVAFSVAALALLKRVDVPNWTPLLSGAFGLLSLASLAKQMLARRHNEIGKN
jgi:hypothetical protein